MTWQMEETMRQMEETMRQISALRSSSETG